MLGPGLALLAWLSRRKPVEWPLPLLLAAAFAISSLLVAATQWLSLTVLPPWASRCAAWAFAALSALCGWWGGRRLLLPAFARPGRWQRWALAAVGGIVAFWLLALPLSPYPAQVTMDLGDPPAYYCHAANLVAGKGWGADYFVADYRQGQASYIKGHPILVLATTLGLQVFGRNIISFHVYNILAGGLLVLLIGSFACRGEGPVFVATIIAALLPAHFSLLGLGVAMTPVALGVLMVAVLAVDEGVGRGMRRFLIAASLAFLVGLRPEGAMLAIALGVALGVRAAVVASRGHQGIRLALASGCVAALVGLWMALPTLVSRLYPAWQDLTLYCVRYDAVRGRFVPMYEPFWEQNRQSCRANLLGEPAAAMGNAAIGAEVRAHPAAFLLYVADRAPLAAHCFVRAISVAQFRFPWLVGAPSVIVLALVLIVGCFGRGGVTLAAAMAAFAVLLQLAIPDPRVRHLLCISPIALALAFRAIWGWRCFRLPSVVCHLLGVVLVVLACLEGWSIIRVRTYGPNRAYEPMLREVESAAAPNALVASGYPQLVTCMTGLRCIGGSWLTENLDAIVERHHPDLILVDDTNDVARNYQLLMERGGAIPGYSPVAHDREKRYILFRCDAR